MKAAACTGYCQMIVHGGDLLIMFAQGSHLFRGRLLERHNRLIWQVATNYYLLECPV